MNTIKHSELDQLAPEIELFKKLQKIGAPRHLIDEIWEQLRFWNKDKIVSRISWNLDNWTEWYKKE